jgi:hypothetical protein
MLLKIETNPVKLAYYTHIRMEANLKELQEDEKMFNKYIKDFSPEQFQQYIRLLIGSITLDQIPDSVITEKTS